MWISLLTACSVPDPTPPPVAEARPCSACHPAEVEAWEGSHHALAERVVSEGDTWAHDLGAVRVIGVHPLQQALVPAEGGRLQAHATAWDPDRGETFPLHTDGREEGDWGHWTGRGMTWNSRCGACHTTAFRKALGDDDTYATHFDALGVTCAACHGDAQEHARGGPPPANPRMEDTCAACHQRRAELGVPFAPGDALLDAYLPTLVDDPVFRADGRGLDEVFAFSNFAASGMHAGGARCGDCHHAHSGALVARGDALCSRCHDDLPQPEAHGPHASSQDDRAGCVDCHMPTLTVMQRHARRDHGFTSPRRGLEPDPCAACHPEHPATAAPDPETEAFAALRSGGPLDTLSTNRWRAAAQLNLLEGRGHPAVLEALASPDPLLRMAAAGAWDVRQPQGMRPLQPLLRDEVRAVRVAAQRSWMSGGGTWADAPDYRRYLDHNADDPLTQGERGLVRIQTGDGGGLDDLRWAREHDPNSPDLVAWMALGLARVGRLRDAVHLLREQIVLHPDHDELRWSLALGLAGLGNDDEAMTVLEGIVAAHPDHARAWRNLALLRKRHAHPGFRAALERAVALNPGDRELAAWAASLEP